MSSSFFKLFSILERCFPHLSILFESLPTSLTYAQQSNPSISPVWNPSSYKSFYASIISSPLLSASVLSICTSLPLPVVLLFICIHISLSRRLSPTTVLSNPLNRCLDPSLSNIHQSSSSFLSFHLFLSLAALSVVSSNWFSFLPASQFFIK